jgi:hypothetical protein
MATPDGLLRGFEGPFLGSVNDSTAYEACRWERILYSLPKLPNGRQPMIYTDLAYRASGVLAKPFASCLTGRHTEVNESMAKFRIYVEQSFGRLKTLFQFVNYSQNLKLLKQDVHAHIEAAAILTNCHSCLNGRNAVSSQTGLAPPSLERYLVR